MQTLRSFLVGLAAFLAIFTPLWFLVGALGAKFGLLDWTIGFGLMAFQWGPLLIMGALAVCFLALGAALLVKPRRGIVVALLALAVPAAGMAYLFYARDQASKVPPIHDIATDIANPPQFSAEVAAARAKITRANDIDFGNNLVPSDPARFGPIAGKDARDLQRQAYPDIVPIRVELDVDDAWAAARDAAEQLGWTITREDQPSGALEATATSFWYGFTDDIVVRVRAPLSQTGAIVDVRSTSRVGLSDLGANAARIRAFRDAFGKRLEAAATGN